MLNVSQKWTIQSNIAFSYDEKSTEISSVTWLRRMATRRTHVWFCRCTIKALKMPRPGIVLQLSKYQIPYRKSSTTQKCGLGFKSNDVHPCRKVSFSKMVWSKWSMYFLSVTVIRLSEIKNGTNIFERGLNRWMYTKIIFLCFGSCVFC